MAAPHRPPPPIPRPGLVWWRSIRTWSLERGGAQLTEFVSSCSCLLIGHVQVVRAQFNYTAQQVRHHILLQAFSFEDGNTTHEVILILNFLPCLPCLCSPTSWHLKRETCCTFSRRYEVLFWLVLEMRECVAPQIALCIPNNSQE